MPAAASRRRLRRLRMAPVIRRPGGLCRATAGSASIPRSRCRLLHPSELSWADVDPEARVFDPGTVPAVVVDLLAAYGPPAPGADWRLIDLWLENVTVGLVEEYGRWAVGWRWSIGEGDL